MARNLTYVKWRQYLGDRPYHQTCPNLPVPPEEKSPIPQGNASPFELWWQRVFAALGWDGKG